MTTPYYHFRENLFSLYTVTDTGLQFLQRSNLITNVSLDLNKYAKEEKTYKAAKRKHTAATAKEEKKKLKQQKKKK